MGVDVYVMVPKSRIGDLSLFEIADLLSYHSSNWFSLPGFLSDESWFDFGRVIPDFVSYIRELRECLDSPGDCEPFDLREEFVKVARMAELLYLLYTTGAFFVRDDDRKVCELYKSGYVPITYVLCGFRDGELEALEESCL